MDQSRAGAPDLRHAGNARCLAGMRADLFHRPHHSSLGAALFLLYYAAYTAYVALNAQEHDALPAFSAVMLQFVIPLTVLTLAIGYVRHRPRQ